MPDELDSLDDLLSDESEVTLADPKLIEAGHAIGCTIGTSGAEALNILLNRGVLFTEGRTEYNEPALIIPAEVGKCLITPVSWSGEQQGEIQLIMPELGAKCIIAYMLALMDGTEANPDGTALDADGLDAYSEAINQFLGNGVQVLRQKHGANLNLTAGKSRIVDFVASAPAMEFGNDLRLISQGQLVIEGAAPVTFYQMLDTEITGIESEIGTGDLQSSVEEVVSEAQVEEQIDVSRVLDLKIPVFVTLAHRKMLLSNIMQVAPGSIVEFRKSSEEFLDLCVGKTVIARGEAVIVNEHFGLQVREILNLRAILNAVQDP